MAVTFCTACGRRRGADERFCGGCGQPFDADAARLPPGDRAPIVEYDAPTRTHSAAPTIVIAHGRRPLWPWVIVASGLAVALVYGAQWMAAYRVLQEVDARASTQLVEGLSGLLTFLRLPDLAAAVDPRNSAFYAQARRELLQSGTLAGLGLLVAVVGLLLAALWRSTAARPGGSIASTAVAIGAALVIGVGLGRGSSDLADLVAPPQATVTATVTAPAARAPTAVTVAAPKVIAGVTAPAGVAPLATATPAIVFYRGEPFGPVKVEPRQSQPLRLDLVASTRVNATLTVQFNNRVSNLSGVPDIDVTILGPGGQQIASYPVARNGTQISFVAPTTGQYTINFDNSRSRVNAKQVGLQFLQP